MMIEPHPPAPVPILCGGESDAALRRAARLCDGWVGYAYALGRRVATSTSSPNCAASTEGTGAVRHPACAAGTAVGGSVQAGRGRRHHRGDVRPWMGAEAARRRSSACGSRSSGSPRPSSGRCGSMSFEADEVRGLVKCLYCSDRPTGLVDARGGGVATGGRRGRRRCSGRVGPNGSAVCRSSSRPFPTVATNSTRFSSTVRTVCPAAGSSARTPANSAASRRPAPRCRYPGIHIDRFQGDMLVTHRGQLDMHRLFEQLGAGQPAPSADACNDVKVMSP